MQAEDKTQKTELFLNDEGKMDASVRQLLVNLMAGPCIDQIKAPDQFKALLTHKEKIEAYFHEMFLQLVVDSSCGIAYLSQINQDQCSQARVLMRKKQLTLLDSIVVMYIRQELINAESQGIACVVELDHAHQALLGFEQKTSDKTAFIKKLSASFEKLKSLGLLSKLAGEENSYEVSAAVKVAFDYNELCALREALGVEFNTVNKTDDIVKELDKALKADLEEAELANDEQETLNALFSAQTISDSNTIG